MNRFFRLIPVILALAALCASLTSCYQAPPTVIDPVDDVTTTAPLTAPTEESGPLKPTVSDVIVLHNTTLPWSDLEMFEHTMTGDNTAHFDVVADNGNICALDVVIDFESGLVTEATLSYGDMTQTLLTNDIFALIDIVRAVNGTNE